MAATVARRLLRPRGPGQDGRDADDDGPVPADAPRPAGGPLRRLQGQVGAAGPAERPGVRRLQLGRLRLRLSLLRHPGTGRHLHRQQGAVRSSVHCISVQSYNTTMCCHISLISSLVSNCWFMI